MTVPKTVALPLGDFPLLALEVRLGRTNTVFRGRRLYQFAYSRLFPWLGAVPVLALAPRVFAAPTPTSMFRYWLSHAPFSFHTTV